MTIRYQTFFFTKGRHWSPFNFRWLHFSVFIIFLAQVYTFSVLILSVLNEEGITNHLRASWISTCIRLKKGDKYKGVSN